MSTRRPAILFALIAMGLDALSVGLIIPVVPQLVGALSHGNPQLTSHALGLMMAMFAAAQLFAAPVLGALSDCFGRRKVILISVAGMTLDYVITAMAPSVGWLYLARIGAGLTAASVVTVNAYIADVTPPQMRAQRFGLVGAVIGSAFVMGPSVGGFLSHFNLRLPFWVAALLCAANLIYGLFVLPESLAPENRRPFAWKRANPFASLKLLASTSDLGRLGAGWFLTWFGMGAFPVAFLLSTTLRFGWQGLENGAAISLFGFTQAIVQILLARRIVALVGERTAARIGYGFTAVGAIVFALANHQWMIWGGCVISGGGSLSMPAIRAMVSSTVDPSRQGEAQGSLSAIEGISQIVAPLVASEIFALFCTQQIYYLPGAPFLVTAAAAAFAVWLLGGLKLKRIVG
jgi:DHA1 family tetracycline resistance protein-like MFS transporter